jgi:hypothetical protein
MLVVAGFGFLLALALFAVPPAGAIGLWIWVRRLHRRVGLPRFARFSTYTLGGVAGILTVGTVAGLVQSMMAIRAPGLSAADKQRILASGVAEALYNGEFGVLLVLVGAIWVAFVRWRGSRRP